MYNIGIPNKTAWKERWLWQNRILSAGSAR